MRKPVRCGPRHPSGQVSQEMLPGVDEKRLLRWAEAGFGKWGVYQTPEDLELLAWYPQDNLCIAEILNEVIWIKETLPGVSYRII